MGHAASGLPAAGGLNSLAKSFDDVEKIAWYRDKTTPKVPLGKSVFAYIGSKGTQHWLRIKIQYAASDWLFVERALVVVDGNKRGQITGSWDRDHSSGTVWESLDLKVSAENIAVVRAMANAKSVTIRFEGRKHYSDFKVPARDLKAIQNVLAAFDSTGSKP